MNSTLLCAGLACVVGAIVGGGLKAFGIEVPLLHSKKRQVLLAVFGIISLLAAYAFRESPPPPNTQKTTRADGPNAIYQAYQLGKIVGWLSFYQTESNYAGSPLQDFQPELAGKEAILQTTLNELGIQIDGTKLNFVGIPGASYDYTEGSNFLESSLKSRYGEKASKAFQLALAIQDTYWLADKKYFSNDMMANMKAQGAVHILDDQAKEFGVKPVSTNTNDVASASYDNWVKDQVLQLDFQTTKALESAIGPIRQ
jgi:hypothetical protein